MVRAGRQADGGGSLASRRMDISALAALPKVVLHDHLDGGLRPPTVIELARDIGYRSLPSEDPETLADWFHQSGAESLESYLDAFEHTFGVMQTPEAMERVAYEAVVDLTQSGVVYAEIRFAPTLHIARGMTRSEAIAGVLAGLARAEADTGTPVRIIVDALRQHGDSDEVVAAALEFVDQGVVGFDLAGPEAGFPATDHASALARARSGGLHLTIHAGEGAGVPSMAGALTIPGLERIGHGVRIAEDVTFDADGMAIGLGAVATRVRDQQITLEVCPTSNMDTKIYADPADHPLGLLHRNGFPVTLNTDNRLMSNTTPTGEFGFAQEHHGFSRDDFRQVTMRAVEAAFCDEVTRSAVRDRVAAGY